MPSINSIARFSSAALLAASASVASANTTIDLDALATGTSLTNLFTGVTISSGDGSTGITSRIGLSGTQQFARGTNTGGFDSLSAQATLAGTLAIAANPADILRIDFINPITMASIELIPNDGNDPGSIAAFNSMGNLVDVDSIVGNEGAGTINVVTVMGNDIVTLLIAGDNTGNNLEIDTLIFSGLLVQSLFSGQTVILVDNLDNHANFVRQRLQLAGGQDSSMLNSYLERATALAAFEGLNLGDGNGQFYVDANYFSSERDTDGSALGFNAYGWGVNVGYDRQINDKLFAGLVFGYDQIDNGASGISDETETDSYNLIAYGRYDCNSPCTRSDQWGDWFVDGMLGYSYNDIESTRAGGISGDTDAHQILADLSVGFERDLSKGATLTPYLGARYIGTFTDGFTESGAGAIVYNDSDRHSLAAYFGASVERSHALNNGWTLTPRAGAEVRFETIDDDESITAALAATPASTFTFDTLNFSDHSVRFNLGADLAKGSNWTAYVDSTLAIAAGDGHKVGVQGGVRIDF